MKFIKFLLIIFITINSPIKADSKQNLINELKQGGKLIFIRHAYAPGGGDPDNFEINDCKTQRNLSDTGREQANKIGYFFSSNNIPIDKVFSSEWCRCQETAIYAFGQYKVFKALNSFYDKIFMKNKKKQIIDLKDYISSWNKNGNVVFVTHFVVISELLGVGTLSGEIIISDKNLNIIGSIILE